MRGKRGIRVFMLSPHGPDEPVPAGADVLARRPEHPQPRDRGRVRRLPGHRQGGQRRRGVQGAHGASAPSTRSTGRASPRRSSTTSRATSPSTRGDGEPVDFAVPSGNFGNILAGHVAQAMGLPIRRLILATNENDVLDEFFRTGRYRPRRDRRDARDVEPVDGHLQGVELRALRLRRRRPRSRRRCATLWAQLERDGGFDLAGDAVLGDGRRRRASSPAAARTPTASRPSATSHARYGVVVDPHTADGVKVGRERRDPGVPLVCIETALPAKFAATIREALGRDPERPAAYADLESRPQRSTRAAAPTSSASRRTSPRTRAPPLTRAPRAAARRGRVAPSHADAHRARQPRAQPRRRRCGSRCFLPVARLAFRIDLAQLVAAARCCRRCSTSASTSSARRRRRFSWLGVGGETYAAAALLLRRRRCSRSRYGSARWRWRCRRWSSPSYPAVQALHARRCWRRALAAGGGIVVGLAGRRAARVDRRRCFVRAASRSRSRRRGRARWPRAVARRAGAAAAALVRRRRSRPIEPWWRAGERGRGADARYPNPASEPVLAAQRMLLDDALSTLDDERPGVDRPLLRRLRRRAASDALRSDVAAAQRGDGRALGDRRPLGRARSTIARSAARAAVGDGDQPARRR